MARIIPLLVVLLFQASPAGWEYSGPKCLTFFCFGQNVPTTAWLAKLGPQSVRPGTPPYCYVLMNGGGGQLLLWSDNSAILSKYPRLVGKLKASCSTTKVNLLTLKTPEGIGLDSTKEEVLGAYGKPTGEQRLDLTGDAPAEEKLIYKGLFHDSVVETTFGLRNGSVSTIELYHSFYAGPDCLGPYCLKSDVLEGSPRNLIKGLTNSMLPQQSPIAIWPYCFEDANGKAFARFEMGHGDPPEPAGVFLGDFAVCVHIPKRFQQKTTIDLWSWKTPEGIGLGSSVEEVRRIYGKPTLDRRFGPDDYKRLVRGYKPGGNVPSVADTLLAYGSEDFSVQFGIRDGRVGFIWLSEGE